MPARRGDDMDVLDLVIIALTVAAAIAGYLLGFLGRVMSWLGLALGFYIGVRLLPTVIVHLASASPGVQLSAAILLLVGGALIGHGLGLVVGAYLHRALPMGPVRLVDRALGAGL